MNYIVDTPIGKRCLQMLVRIQYSLYLEQGFGDGKAYRKVLHPLLFLWVESSFSGTSLTPWRVDCRKAVALADENAHSRYQRY